MFYVRVAFWGVLGLLLLTVALANRGPVTFSLIPADLALFLASLLPAGAAGIVETGVSVTVPLYFIIFLAIVAGIAIGYAAEWLREAKYRSAASKEHQELVMLKHEMRGLKVDEGKGDDVLALLDDASRT